MEKNGFEYNGWRFSIKTAYPKIEKCTLYQCVNHISVLFGLPFYGSYATSGRESGA